MSSGERGSPSVKMLLPSSLLQALGLTRPSTQQSSAPVVYLRILAGLGILPRPLSNENEVELTFSAKNDQGYTILSLAVVRVVTPSSSDPPDGLSRPGEGGSEATSGSAPTATPSSLSATRPVSSSATRPSAPTLYPEPATQGRRARATCQGCGIRHAVTPSGLIHHHASWPNPSLGRCWGGGLLPEEAEED